MTKLKLKRKSICVCGEPVMFDSIEVGTEYTIDETTQRSGFVYRCGNCGLVQSDVEVVKASCVTNPNARMAWLPTRLFINPQ